MTIRALLPAIASLALACTSPSPAPEPPAPATPPAQPDAAPDWAGAVEREASRLHRQWPDAVIRISVMDLSAGTIPAEVGPVEIPHLTGSTIKPFSVAVAFEHGVRPDRMLDGSPVRVGEREAHDAHPVESMRAADVLVRSSNVGTIRLVQKIGPRRVYDEVTTLLVEPRAPDITEEGATAWLTGVGTRLTMHQLMHAYAVLVLGIRDPDTHDPLVEGAAATAVLDALERAVATPDGTSNAAAIEGLRIAGKSGTAPGPGEGASTVSFFGAFPRAWPHWLVGVVVEGVPEDQYGGTLAAGSFAAIVRDALGDQGR